MENMEFDFTCSFFIGNGQEKNYQENLEASVSILKKLSDEWREHSSKLPYEPLRETLKNFRQKVVSLSFTLTIYRCN